MHLGYISLQQRLTNDEVLAVAYEYTIGIKCIVWRVWK
jgi:cell surface protein SprA